MGQHDIPNSSHVKLYCAKCEDIYNPKSSRHNSIDGAYFGTSFHNILFQVYPMLLPQKTQRRYEPRIYGFRVHASAALMRWQEERREEMKDRLRARALETGFEDGKQSVVSRAPPQLFNCLRHLLTTILHSQRTKKQRKLRASWKLTRMGLTTCLSRESKRYSERESL